MYQAWDDREGWGTHKVVEMDFTGKPRLPLHPSHPAVVPGVWFKGAVEMHPFRQLDSDEVLVELIKEGVNPFAHSVQFVEINVLGPVPLGNCIFANIGQGLAARGAPQDLERVARNGFYFVMPRVIGGNLTRGVGDTDTLLPQGQPSRLRGRLRRRRSL